MKKILLFLCLFMFPYFLNAECSYSDIKELNALASHINYTFDYSESDKSFTVSVMNINDSVVLRYNNTAQKVSNNEVVLKGFSEGAQLRLDIYSNASTGCYNEHLRVIKISIPYLNDFYNSSLCEGHEELVVCNSRFLDYKISYQTFINLINKANASEVEKDDDVVIDSELTLIEKIVVFLQEIWIKVVVFILSGLASYMVFSNIYRKVKHRL